MDQDPIPQVKPIESIINQLFYITSSHQADQPESTLTPVLSTYQITTEEQRKEQSEKPPIKGEVYVFKNKDEEKISIDIRIYASDETEILNLINFFQQYLSQFNINPNTQIIIVIGEGSLRLSYQELKTILSDENQTKEKIGRLPIKGEITTIDSHFQNTVNTLLGTSEFLNAYYENPEIAIASLREEIKKSYREFSQVKAERLEELIEILRQKLDTIKANVDPKKAQELLSLTPEEVDARIQQLSAIPNDFFTPLIEAEEQPLITLVDPNAIITAESKNTNSKGESWQDYLSKRAPQFMKNLIIAFLNGRYPFLEKPAINDESRELIILIHLGNGKYVVKTGRHRIVVAKLLGAKSICCQVYELAPRAGEKRRINPNNIYHLEYLIKEGKIKGRIEKVEEDGYTSFYIIFDERPNPIYLFQNPNLAKTIIGNSN